MRWFALPRAGLWALTIAMAVASASAPASTDILKTATAEVNAITAVLSSSNGKRQAQENPMYGCYELGRLQGVSDRLAMDIQRIEARTDLTEAQTSSLNLTREFYIGLEAQLADAIAGKGCDPMAGPRLKELNRGRSSIEHMRLAIAATQTMSAEDLVTRCFYVGRLSSLSNRLRADITRLSRSGRPVSASAQELFREAAGRVKKAAPSCGA